MNVILVLFLQPMLHMVRMHPLLITASKEKEISKERFVMLSCNLITAAVAEWLRAWETLTMFEATVCGRS